MQHERIIIPTHEFYPKRGGIAIYVEEMANCLHQNQYPVEVWAPKHPELQNKPFPYPIIQLNNKGSLSWKDRRTTALQLLKNQKTLKQSTLLIAEPGPLLTLLDLDKRGIFPYQNLMLIIRCARKKQRRQQLQSLLNKAYRIGNISRFTELLLLRYFKVDKAKLCRVPGGLRSDFQIYPKQATSNEFTTILSVGRIHPRKGQLALIEAVARYNKEFRKQIRLRFVGPKSNPSYQLHCQQFAKKNEISCEFLNNISDADLPAQYAQADLFALTSQHTKLSVEGYGLCLIEANAAGLPVIAHRSGGIPNAIIHNKTGILVSPHNRQQLADAIQLLANNSKLRQTLAHNGQQHARRHSWQHNIDALFSA